MSPMSVLRRPGLLLSAAMTITVPSVLATVAVLGHEHGIQEARAEALSLGADAPPASLPAGSASAALSPVLVAGPPAVRDAAAQMLRVSGMSMHGPVFGGAAEGQQGAGLRLLGRAAAAGLDTSYQGVELIAQSGVTGTVTMISSVWHRGGGLTVTQTSDAAVLGDAQPYVAYAGDDRSSEGVFGVTKTLVGMLGRHYLAVFTGTGSAVGRPAFIVELHRADGSLAARFWLDSKTLVPLRRDVFDTSAQLVGEDAFVQVQFGPLAAPPGAASPVPLQWSRVAAPAKLLLDLDGHGWQLPAVLPGGLALYEAAQSQTGTGQIVDLGYSDGLSVISLFVERGTLAKMAGWQPVSLSGHVVYAAEHSITWAGRGFVYTVIADAPPQTVEQVVAALPQNSAPGFLARIGRGLDRLASLVNPFR
jgi:sigma-E factor negative regulatory protein RseB